MDLIKNLQQDHEKLIKMLEELTREPFSLILTRRKLLEMRHVMEEHLKKEDQEFYPLLKYEAIKNPDLKKILLVFSKEMAEISLQAGRFFNACESGSNILDFQREALQMLSLLKTRIRKEESVLYPWLAQVQSA